MKPSRWGGEKEDKVLLCGEDAFMAYTATEAKNVSCPDCSKKLALKQIAERPAEAPALELVKLEDTAYTRYRYTYRIMFGGEHFGYVGLDGAYGKARWHIAQITTQDADDEVTMLGNEVERKRVNSLNQREYTDKVVYFSKEAALADVPNLIQEGVLKSAAQTIKDAKEWRVEKAKRRAAWDKREAEDKQERADTIAGLKEMKAAAEAGQLALTNFQADALVNAIAYLNRKEV